MDSIDISDLAFSLGNFSAVNEVLSSTSESVADFIPESVADFIPDSDADNNFFLYLGIGIILAIVGIYVYNYFVNKNRHVRFQDNVENYYQEAPHNYQEAPHNYQTSDF